MRELAEREGIDLAASYAYSDSESDLPMLRAVGHPVAVNPDAELRARRARGGLGDHALRAARPAPEGRRRGRRWPRWRAPARRAVAARARAMSLHELTDEQREIRDLARRFADERDRAARRRVGPRAPLPARASSPQLGELGLMGVCVPEEHGGAGADFLSYVLVLEELSRADAGVGVTVAVHTSAGTLPLLDHGTPEQVERLRPAAGPGRRARGLRADRVRLGLGRRRDAHARRRRPHHRHQAVDHQRLVRPHASSSSRATGRRASAFVVRRGAQGFAVTREEEKLGLNSSSTADLAFEDTPAERLGEPGAGMRIALRTLDGGRIGIAAQAVGIAQAALDVAAALRARSATPSAADRRLRRDPAEARRHADRDRGGPRARLARRAR